jgi:hypothetical protein
VNAKLRICEHGGPSPAAGRNVLGQAIQGCAERCEWSSACDPGNDRQRFLTHRLVS